jgi:hypothetical protein
MRAIAVVLASVLAMAAISGLTRAPWTPPGSDAAVLRFSWRMNIQAREHCRARTAAELEALPVHMRTPEVCEADDAGYYLITRLDGAAPDTLVLARGGVRGDRPLFVMRDLRLEPGSYEVMVELRRVSAEGSVVLAALDTSVTLAPGQVRLITSSDAGDALMIRSNTN